MKNGAVPFYVFNRPSLGPTRDTRLFFLPPSLAMALFSLTDATGIATIRTLAADVVGKANSGHPGEHHPSRPVPRVIR